jgi:hypothetical protein
LWHDANGNADGGLTLIARLPKAVTLDATDLLIF